MPSSHHMEQKTFIEVSCNNNIQKTFLNVFFSVRVKKLLVYFGFYESCLHFQRKEGHEKLSYEHEIQLRRGLTRNDLYYTICMTLIRFMTTFIYLKSLHTNLKRQRTHPIFQKLYHTNSNAESYYDFAIYTFRLIDQQAMIILTPKKSHTNRTVQIFPCKTAFRYLGMKFRHLVWCAKV